MGAPGTPGALALAETVGEGVEDDISKGVVAGDYLPGWSFDSY